MIQKKFVIGSSHDGDEPDFNPYEYVYGLDEAIAKARQENDAEIAYWMDEYGDSKKEAIEEANDIYIGEVSPREPVHWLFRISKRTGKVINCEDEF